MHLCRIPTFDFVAHAKANCREDGVALGTNTEPILGEECLLPQDERFKLVEKARNILDQIGVPGLHEMLRPLSSSGSATTRPVNANVAAVEPRIPTPAIPNQCPRNQPSSIRNGTLCSATSKDTPKIIVRAGKFGKRTNAEKHRNRKKKRSIERRELKKSLVCSGSFEITQAQKQQYTQTRRSNARSSAHIAFKFVRNANVVSTNMTSNDLSPSHPGFVGTPSSKDTDLDIVIHSRARPSELRAAGYVYVPSDPK